MKEVTQLQPETAKFMKAVRRDLKERGLYIPLYEGTLRLLEQAYEQFIIIDKHIQHDGCVTGMEINPWMRAKEKAWSVLKPLLKEFGLTPSSSVSLKRMQSITDARTTEPENPFNVLYDQDKEDED